MSGIILSICIPTIGHKLEKISRQLLEFEKSYSNSIELVYSISSQRNDTSRLMKLKMGSAKIYVHSSGESFAANLENSIRRASGEYILLLGDDDIIEAKEILELQRLLLSSPKIRLGFTELHKDDSNRVQSLESEISIKKRGSKSLSPAVAAMRSGALPGILLCREAIRLDLLNNWLKWFPQSIYPQIVIALTSLSYELRERARTIDVSIEVGKGEGLLDPTFERLGDYGAEERLKMSSDFLSLGVFNRLDAVRYQVNLALWESSIISKFRKQHPRVTRSLLRSQLALFTRFPIFSGTLLIHRLWSRFFRTEKS